MFESTENVNVESADEIMRSALVLTHKSVAIQSTVVDVELVEGEFDRFTSTRSPEFKIETSRRSISSSESSPSPTSAGSKNKESSATVSSSKERQARGLEAAMERAVLKIMIHDMVDLMIKQCQAMNRAKRIDRRVIQWWVQKSVDETDGWEDDNSIP
ncbi:hypothetical protein PsorP6_014248 [Peronosclerospora sorghi]|uniref:Uncharacterized protein n=1 Tax=Peronosclerospora sorghi TaxID=230839 RepID=A0ACC0VHF2_9STRA|nr:hypothetical protein PsorP6_014248 [Peronosclerospora sorghi]